ncbi:MAG: hypothetical protein WC824_13205 [Bacteroidota bacterium]|jgi:hypothetical protein
MRKWILSLFIVILCVGCAGVSRGCSSCNAGAFGANWVVVKMDLEGRPYRCWMLKGVSISNESQSDGIYWKSSDGHLVHISGHYNRVQVERENWESALAELGMSEATCKLISLRRFDAEANEYRLPGSPVITKNQARIVPGLKVNIEGVLSYPAETLPANDQGL